jgi:hypothetical protein
LLLLVLLKKKLLPQLQLQLHPQLLLLLLLQLLVLHLVFMELDQDLTEDQVFQLLLVKLKVKSNGNLGLKTLMTGKMDKLMHMEF